MAKYGIYGNTAYEVNMLDKISRKAQVIIVVGFGIIIFYGGIKYQHTRLDTIEIQQPGPVEQAESPPAPKMPELLTVHLVGAVEKPGVYTLEKGQRINDAVQMAVPLEKADLTQINLAESLQDGKQIYVPAKGEKAPPATASRIGVKASGLVNINTAGAGELDKLPGIGPALAGRIIAYREKNGPFGKVDDIIKVSGIGPALLAKIKAQITTE